MDDLRVTFSLWNPAIVGFECRCFDVRPQEFVQLNRGTESLVEGFLHCLEICGKPLQWTIEPLCSPYFADVNPGNNYLDRYPAAWRARVQLADRRQSSMRPREIFGPHVCSGLDSTWEEVPESWAWTDRGSIVIADMAEQQFPETMRNFRDQALFTHCRGVETIHLAAGFVQARFDLGFLKFPDDAGRIDEFVNAGRELPVSLNWVTSLHMALKTGD
jgi:hypothetical protein